MPFTLTTAALLSFVGLPGLASDSVQATPARASAPAEAGACDITGQATLPEEAPKGIDAHGLCFDHAVGKLEELPPREPMPRPDNWNEMEAQERAQWSADWHQSEDALAYWERVREQFENRRVYTVTVEPDGSFHAEDILPGRYNLTLVIPGDGAIGEDRYEDCRGRHLSRITVPEGEGTTVGVGERPLELFNAVTIGSIAPDFTVPNLEGGTVTLSDFRGQYVFVDFWATWCAPCCAETPNVLAAHNALADQGLAVITLSLDNNRDLPIAYAREHELPFVQGYLGPWNQAELTRQYGVRGIPHTLLIGPDGTVLAKRLRGEGLPETIREAMATQDQEQDQGQE